MNTHRIDLNAPGWAEHLERIRLASYLAERARLDVAPTLCAWCGGDAPDCTCASPPALHHPCGVCGLAEPVRERESPPPCVLREEHRP